jgi:hypothetical protein
MAYFLILWSLFTGAYSSALTVRSDESQCMLIAQQLVDSSGQPFNWTASPLNASSIGLASTPGVLDNSRVAAFFALPYGNAKQLVGASQNFYVGLVGENGEAIASIGNGTANSTTSVELTRVAVYNGSIVDLEVRVYG